MCMIFSGFNIFLLLEIITVCWIQTAILVMRESKSQLACHVSLNVCIEGDIMIILFTEILYVLLQYLNKISVSASERF